MKLSTGFTARHLIAGTLFVSAAFFATPRLHAQKGNPQPETPSVDAQKRVTLEFNEAYLSEAADFLAKQFDGANFVVPPKVARLRVTVKLRNVTLDQALQAIAFATENRLQINQVAENVYGFSIADGQPGSAPDERAMCRIFSLASAPAFIGIAPDKVNKMVTELKETLENAINMLRRAEPTSTVETPPLQFHPSTKLLIAVGKPGELAILEQLVMALGGGASPILDPATGLPFTPGGPAPGSAGSPAGGAAAPPQRGFGAPGS
jgi:hypothetical protein